jgi:hypothetical protein
MRQFYITLLCLSISSISLAQNWEWAIHENIKIFAVDSAGNIFVHNDTTIKRFNSHGILQWQKKFSGDLVIKSLVANNSGDLYIAGVFTKFLIDSCHLISLGNRDIFFCKMDSSGSLLWKKIFGGPNDDNVADMFLNKQQKILISGNIGIGTFIENENIFENKLFISRYDGYGNLELLVQHHGGTGWEVTTDTSGNIYLLGGINKNDTLDFGNGVILYGYEISDPFGSYYIAKFNTAGDILWAKDMGTDYYALFQNLAVDNNGNYYLTKWRRYQGFDFSKFDGSGNFMWNHNINGVYGSCNSLCIDNNENIWMTGDIWSDPFKGLPYIWEFNSSNNLSNTTRATILASGNNIANDYNNNIYVSGTFIDRAEFGITTLLASEGNYFLAKKNRK